MSEPMSGMSGAATDEPHISNLALWFRKVLEVLPSTARSDAEHIGVDDQVKVTVQLDVPLRIAVPDDAAPLPGPFEVQHLHTNVNVSKVVLFQEQDQQTMCVLPHKTFPVEIDTGAAGPQPMLSSEQYTEVSATYREHIKSALKILGSFPHLSQLDIDVCGQLPRDDHQLKMALSTINISVYLCALQSAPSSLSTITVQTGANLDVMKKVPVGRKGGTAWELKESYVCGGWPIVNPLGLSQVQDSLRGEGRVQIYPEGKSVSVVAEKQEAHDEPIASGGPEAMEAHVGEAEAEREDTADEVATERKDSTQETPENDRSEAMDAETGQAASSEPFRREHTIG